MMTYFIIYTVANFIAMLIAEALVTRFLCGSSLKLLVFSVLVTVAQFFLFSYIHINIIYMFFVFSFIYMIVLFILEKITRLVRISGFGALLKTSIIVVLVQLGTKILLNWKLAEFIKSIKF